MFRGSRFPVGSLRQRSVVIVLLWLGVGPTWAETVRVGGSGGPLACIHLLADEFKKAHPEAELTVVGNLGSSGGIKAVLGGVLDVGLSSRPLKASELAHGVVGIEYARTPFVFAVGTQNKPAAGAITSRELIGIYRGDIKKWPDGRALRLVLRPEADSDTLVIRAMSMEMSEALASAHTRRGMILAATDQDSVASIEKVPGAIGTTTLAQILCERRQLVALALDGITPTVNMLVAGKYPAVKPFFLVIGAQPSPVTRRFTEFVQSEKAKEVLNQYGHWMGPFPKLRPAAD